MLLLCVYVCVRDTRDLYCRESSTHTGNSKTRVPRRREHCLPFSLYIHHQQSSYTHLQVFNFIVLHGVAITLRDGGGVVNR